MAVKTANPSSLEKQNIMKKLLITALAFGPMTIFGQSAERQVIASTGGFSSTSNLQVSYTVGQTVTATGISSSLIVTQGFQQPNASSVGVEELESGLSVNVYPNPVSDNLVVEINATNALTINATVYDMQGRQTGIAVSNLKVNGTLKQTLDVSALSAGQYLISFTDGRATLGTVRIQKVN